MTADQKFSEIMRWVRHELSFLPRHPSEMDPHVGSYFLVIEQLALCLARSDASFPRLPPKKKAA